MEKDKSVYSEGARYERKAILAKLRRELKQVAHLCKPFEVEVLHDLEKWILARRIRYEAKPGGLGRRQIKNKKKI